MASISKRAARRPGTFAALALTLALVSAGAVALTNTDSLVERGFATALKRPTSVAVQQTAQVSVPVAGSEEFWLSPASAAATAVPREISLASWTAPVKLGGTVTLTISGEVRVLEVLDIAEMPAGVTRVDTTSPASRLVVVSLREAGKPGAAPIRFVVEAGPNTTPQIAVAPPRAL